MLPSFEEISGLWEAIAEGDASVTLHEDVIRHCLAVAEQHVESPMDEPAALFYAFAEQAHKFDSSFPPFFVDWVAISQCVRLGLPCSFNRSELRALRIEVTLKIAGFEEAREWFEQQFSQRIKSRPPH